MTLNDNFALNSKFKIITYMDSGRDIYGEDIDNVFSEGYIFLRSYGVSLIRRYYFVGICILM